jgi:hypothetical protein
MNKGGGADTGTKGERRSRLGVALQKIKRVMTKDVNPKTLQVKKKKGYNQMSEGGMAEYYKDLM